MPTFLAPLATRRGMLARLATLASAPITALSRRSISLIAAHSNLANRLGHLPQQPSDRHVSPARPFLSLSHPQLNQLPGMVGPQPRPVADLPTPSRHVRRQP